MKKLYDKMRKDWFLKLLALGIAFLVWLINSMK